MHKRRTPCNTSQTKETSISNPTKSLVYSLSTTTSTPTPLNPRSPALQSFLPVLISLIYQDLPFSMRESTSDPPILRRPMNPPTFILSHPIMWSMLNLSCSST